MKSFHLHCVSDSTGDTIRTVSRACLVQFEGAEPIEHLWPLARTPRAIERVLKYIEADPGPVIFTIVNEKLRDQLMMGWLEPMKPMRKRRGFPGSSSKPPSASRYWAEPPGR